MKTNRFATGCYTIKAEGRTWQASTIEWATEGRDNSRGWVLYESDLNGHGEYGSDLQYWNHFPTLSDCKVAVSEGLAETARRLADKAGETERGRAMVAAAGDRWPVRGEAVRA